MVPFTLVMGGARSGKSAFALSEAEAFARGSAPHGRLVMVATAEPLDLEMEQRIARHKEERGPNWTTIEAPLSLPDAIRSLQESDTAVVDCLTLWVSNLMMRSGTDVQRAVERLERALVACNANLWVVSNEVGFGIVPENPLARRFRDEAGRANQAIARSASQVVLIVAGCSLKIRGPDRA